MLDGAFTSPKIRRLAAILEIPWPHALGLAGLLWRFAAKHAPTGEVGRHDDEEIAAFLEWPGDAVDLVAALTRCRLLDAVDGPARLLVHDWPDHAPRYVEQKLRRAGGGFSPHYASAALVAVVPPGDPALVPGQQEPRSRTQERGSEKDERSPSAPPSTSSPSPSPPSTPTPSRTLSPTKSPAVDPILEIWNLWVPGRKTAKTKALASIRDSIRRLVGGGLTREEAIAKIRAGTKKDAERYRKDLANRITEIQFVPLGSTYFSQERWLDDDEPLDLRKERDDAIEDEIERLRSS